MAASSSSTSTNSNSNYSMSNDPSTPDIPSSSSSHLLSKYPRHNMADGRHQLKIGILGATGTVGQRFITLLENHPWFDINVLGASERSANKPYPLAVKWKQTTPMPGRVREMIVRECKPEHFKDCKVVFSGLDADVAGDIEAAFLQADIPIFSNAKNYRRHPQVPLVVPLVNPNHLSIIPQQQSNFTISSSLPPLSLKKGFIVTNANCSTTGVVVPLAALEKSFGPIESAIVTTMQAISGAGYPGLSALDIMDNVVPYISGEEEKIEWETLKILGYLVPSDDPAEGADGKPLKKFDMHSRHPLRVSASCNRVAVIDGHTATVSVRFSRRPPPSPQQVREALVAFTPDAQTLGCPSAPTRAIVVHEEPDRPQPRLDRYFQDGAGVNVGRVRQCQVLDVKFVVLANNVSIGAATSSIMNAELAILKGYVSDGSPSEEVEK